MKQLANLYEETRDFGEAEKYCKMAEEVLSEGAMSSVLCRLCFHKQEYEKAIEHSKKAIAYSQQNSKISLHQNLGDQALCHFLAGQQEEGYLMLERARQFSLDKNHSLFWSQQLLNLSFIDILDGKLESAEQSCKSALELLEQYKSRGLFLKEGEEEEGKRVESKGTTLQSQTLKSPKKSISGNTSRKNESVEKCLVQEENKRKELSSNERETIKSLLNGAQVSENKKKKLEILLERYIDRFQAGLQLAGMARYELMRIKLNTQDPVFTRQYRLGKFMDDSKRGSSQISENASSKKVMESI